MGCNQGPNWFNQKQSMVSSAINKIKIIKMVVSGLEILCIEDVKILSLRCLIMMKMKSMKNTNRNI